ncbi:AraC family transcriptional regulator [Mastigocoleus testarum]|uniref:AraC family transcriptional regulator n=1 Tax=Mastigocoleus testarum BC008 TaxID=371196 RepID=A0A0V7ZNJ2_9CYAN|nr:AraC family transcriptional regulator [Mastigocoleus testarum]KST65975.1 AraC family transcriptional regulator [Mastigocoleus testarum BC008]
MNDISSNSNFTIYLKRFSKVLDYINTHLDENMSLDDLSQVAACSKYHFHRQFTELFGINIGRLIQLLRLKRASYQLAFRKEIRIIDIALASGFENPESFSRAFKNNIGQTPSKFRNQPEWNSWYEKYQLLKDLRILHMKSSKHTHQVRIVDFREAKVAVLEHHGSPQLLGNSIQKFIEWRKQNQISPKTSKTFNVIYNDPKTTEPEKFHFDICASVRSGVKDNKFGVITKVIPAGRCAVLRHVGTDENLGESVNYLYKQWLPLSGEELRGFPLFVERVSFFPDVPEHEAIADIYLPLR